MRVTSGGELVAVMHPQHEFFNLQQQDVSKTAIRTTIVADLYLAMGNADGHGNWTVRAYWKPLVPFIWIGAVIMAFGGFVSLSDRRWRVGVASRARRAPEAVAVAGE
jgi:cytochrome c-type biogenesis protein CcmF